MWLENSRHNFVCKSFPCKITNIAYNVSYTYHDSIIRWSTSATCRNKRQLVAFRTVECLLCSCCAYACCLLLPQSCCFCVWLVGGNWTFSICFDFVERIVQLVGLSFDMFLVWTRLHRLSSPVLLILLASIVRAFDVSCNTTFPMHLFQPDTSLLLRLKRVRRVP